MVMPGLDLRFVPERAGYDALRDEVRFSAFAGQSRVSCAVGRAVLESLVGDNSLDREGCLRVLHDYRNKIEQALRTRFLTQPVEALEDLRLTHADLA
jgi:hypothetical protein